MTKTNWDLLLDGSILSLMQEFAENKISGRTMSSALKNTKYAGEFRNLIRSKGVTRAQSLARRALSRRCKA